MTNEKETFYEECAKVLGVESAYKAPYHDYKWPNRWNNRAPGNGRFEGRGLVQMYGPSCIHIVLHHPQKVNKQVRSTDEAIAFLKEIMSAGTN